MATNFWEAQRRARSKTKMYLFLFLLLTFFAAALGEWILREYSGNQYQPPVPLFAAALVLVTTGTALFQYSSYGVGGGGVVARAVGGKRITQKTMNPQERVLYHIVEEMALASSQPMPEVYIIEERSINAFAAGLTANKAAIAMTRGALDQLNRDEVQAVIAHEFGHIANGDMKISLRLSAMLMGFFALLYLGVRLMEVAVWMPPARSRRDEKESGNGLLFIALLLILVGSCTWLFGAILRACVSREREYLADASSVQFTRSTTAIVSALHKIGREVAPKMPSAGMAYQHLYFDHRGFFPSLFATHPPLEKRIAAILGRRYIPEEWDAKNS